MLLLIPKLAARIAPVVVEVDVVIVVDFVLVVLAVDAVLVVMVVGIALVIPAVDVVLVVLAVDVVVMPAVDAVVTGNVSLPIPSTHPENVSTQSHLPMLSRKKVPSGQVNWATAVFW